MRWEPGDKELSLASSETSGLCLSRGSCSFAAGVDKVGAASPAFLDSCEALLLQWKVTTDGSGFFLKPGGPKLSPVPGNCASLCRRGSLSSPHLPAVLPQPLPHCCGFQPPKVRTQGAALCMVCGSVALRSLQLLWSHLVFGGTAARRHRSVSIPIHLRATGPVWGLCWGRPREDPLVAVCHSILAAESCAQSSIAKLLRLPLCPKPCPAAAAP